MGIGRADAPFGSAPRPYILWRVSADMATALKGISVLLRAVLHRTASSRRRAIVVEVCFDS